MIAIAIDLNNKTYKLSQEYMQGSRNCSDQSGYAFTNFTDCKVDKHRQLG